MDKLKQQKLNEFPTTTKITDFDPGDVGRVECESDRELLDDYVQDARMRE